MYHFFQIFIADVTLCTYTTIGDCGGLGLEYVLKSALAFAFHQKCLYWFPQSPNIVFKAKTKNIFVDGSIISLVRQFYLLRLTLAGGDIAFHRKLVSPISVASLHLLLLAELLHYCANSLIIMKKKVFGGKKHNKLLLAASTQCFEI